MSFFLNGFLKFSKNFNKVDTNEDTSISHGYALGIYNVINKGVKKMRGAIEDQDSGDVQIQWSFKVTYP